MTKNARLLPQLVMDLRGETRQKELARRIGVTSSYISQVESGVTVPKDEKLVEFARALHAEERLPELLLRAAHDRVSDEAGGEPARRAYQRVIEDVDAKGSDSKSPAPRRTLEYFPRAFEPLVIVTGDRREDPPKTCGDVGALSASPIDDRYVREIPLAPNTDKISDKVFVVAEDSYLKRRFGATNLLVIGSPASNHLARIVNRGALFRFAFDPRTSREIDEIIQGGEKAMEEGGVSNLKVFRDGKMAELKFIMNEFKQGGIFDPLFETYRVRARSLRDGVDFATVTIAKHPYADSDDFVAIMAAGFHLPGTVHAMKFLSSPLQFESHPFGGVVEVRMSESTWYERIEKADAVWDTQSYDVTQLISALERLAMLQTAPAMDDEAGSAGTLVALVRKLRGQPREHSTMSDKT